MKQRHQEAPLPFPLCSGRWDGGRNSSGRHTTCFFPLPGGTYVRRSKSSSSYPSPPPKDGDERGTDPSANNDESLQQQWTVLLLPDPLLGQTVPSFSSSSSRSKPDRGRNEWMVDSGADFGEGNMENAFGRDERQRRKKSPEYTKQALFTIYTIARNKDLGSAHKFRFRPFPFQQGTTTLKASRLPETTSIFRFRLYSVSFAIAILIPSSLSLP